MGVTINLYKNIIQIQTNNAQYFYWTPVVPPAAALHIRQRAADSNPFGATV